MLVDESSPTSALKRFQNGQGEAPNRRRFFAQQELRPSELGLEETLSLSGIGGENFGERRENLSGKRGEGEAFPN